MPCIANPNIILHVLTNVCLPKINHSYYDIKDKGFRSKDLCMMYDDVYLIYICYVLVIFSRNYFNKTNQTWRQQICKLVIWQRNDVSEQLLQSQKKTDTLPAWEKAPSHLGGLKIESQKLGKKYFTNLEIHKLQSIFLDQTNPRNISRHHLRPHERRHN